MARRVDALLERIIALPAVERHEFVRRLRVALRPDEFEESADGAWLAEIERRLAAFDSGRTLAKPAQASVTAIRRALARTSRRAR